MSYAGESIAKKVARFLAYAHARRVLWEQGQKTVKTLALAGPTAADVDLVVASGLGLPSDVFLVDTEADGLAVAQAKHPDVNVFHGPLHQAIPPWRVDLAVLDWCGHGDSPQAEAAYRQLRHFVGLGSVFVVTYACGREGGRSQTRGRVGKYKRAYPVLRKENAPDWENDWALARRESVMDAIGEGIGALNAANHYNGKEWQPALCKEGLVRYYGHAMPMEILVLSVRRKHQAERLMRRIVKQGLASATVSKDPKLDLLEIIDELEAKGSPLDLIAKAFHVGVGTIAAWRAHRTMGTYAEAG